MLKEEAVDRSVRCPFDLSIQVLLVPVFRRHCIEVVVVARKAVPDVGPGAERGPFVECELARPARSTAAHDGSMRCGLSRNLQLKFLVSRGKGEEAHDGTLQLVAVAILLSLA